MSNLIWPQTRSNLMMVAVKFFDLLKVSKLKLILANSETLRKFEIAPS